MGNDTKVSTGVLAGALVLCGIAVAKHFGVEDPTAELTAALTTLTTAAWQYLKDVKRGND